MLLCYSLSHILETAAADLSLRRAWIVIFSGSQGPLSHSFSLSLGWVLVGCKKRHESCQQHCLFVAREEHVNPFSSSLGPSSVEEIHPDNGPPPSHLHAYLPTRLYSTRTLDSDSKLTVQNPFLDQLTRLRPVCQFPIEPVSDLGTGEVGFLTGEGVVR